MTNSSPEIVLADKLTAYAHGLYSAAEAGMILEAAKILRAPAQAVSRETIEKVLCCPKGCLRHDDCFVTSPGARVRYTRTKHEREQADAIMALYASAPPQAASSDYTVLIAKLESQRQRDPEMSMETERLLEATAEAIRTLWMNVDNLESEIVTIQEAPAAPQSAPRWRHLKRGSIVTEVARGFAQVAHHPIEEMTAVVIYKHEADGVYWVRNAVEFDDGRFEPYPLSRLPHNGAEKAEGNQS